MGRRNSFRTAAAKELEARRRAAARVSATALGADHPVVAAAIRWQQARASVNTVATTTCDFTAFFAHCAALGLDPMAITRHEAKAFVVAQRSLGYAPGSQCRRVTTLRSLYDEMVEDGLIAANPFHRVRAGNRDPIIPTPALTVEQVDRLIESTGARVRSGAASPSDHRNAAMAYVMVRVGPRSAEVARAVWSELGQRGDAVEWRILGKGSRWASVILPPDVVEALEDWRSALADALGRPVRGDDPIFPALYHSPVSGRIGRATAARLHPLARRTIGMIFKGLLADIGIEGPRYGPHVARATAATLAYAASKDLIAVQRLLRHLDQGSTVRYIRNATTDSPASMWTPTAAPPTRRRRQGKDGAA